MAILQKIILFGEEFLQLYFFFTQQQIAQNVIPVQKLFWHCVTPFYCERDDT